jgi:ribosomal protein S18 acetylase RimI-like enzyme
MSQPEPVRFRLADASDAPAVAALHADSWRRHYRGAYADAFLDGDVLSDRLAVWADRLGAGRDPNGQHTVLAEAGGELVGFAHTIFGKDPRWGALLDNLHVSHRHQRRGLGAQLLRLSGAAVADSVPGSGLYLWVLEQNTRAQAFYQALGGTSVERGKVPAPGGVPGRLNGSPACFRYAWPDPTTLRPTSPHQVVTSTPPG